MKNIIKKIFVLLFFTFIININFAYALETENNTDNEKETEIIEDNNNIQENVLIENELELNNNEENNNLQEVDLTENELELNNDEENNNLQETDLTENELELNNNEENNNLQEADLTENDLELNNDEENNNIQENVLIENDLELNNNEENNSNEEVEIKSSIEQYSSNLADDDKKAEEVEAKNEVVQEEVVTSDETNEEEDNISGAPVYDIQKVKVVIKKIDEDEKKPLVGALLQVLDKDGNILDEWRSTTEAHEILLSNGTYTLHEKEAPEGYDLAQDKVFTVEVQVAQIDAGADYSATPCPHYLGTPMYYVEIEGSKHEVYCINQGWETPDDDSQYDGELLNSGSIRDYTKQTVPVGLQDEDATKVIMSDGPIDISDQTLTDQELYDKILDIIYHRHIASEILGQEGLTYSVEEIRFITEVALKNYTNSGLAERQYNVNATDALIAAFEEAGVIYKTYYVNNIKKVSYIKHNYRDYVYTPDVPLGQDIVRTDYGKGNSFGQMVAGHWNSYSNKNHLHPDADPSTQAHNAKNNQEERDKVARYYRLFEFLISSNNPHPEGMNLYIYSSTSVPQDLSSNNHDAKYQNLLGVTGYFEDIPQQEQEVILENSYSTEKTSIPVKKIWDDNNNQDGKRPTEIKVILYADKKEVRTVLLSEENDWSYTFEDLDVYNKGKKIEYAINEISVKDYETKVNGFTITNTHKVEKTSIPVKKIWDDNNNQDGKRPTEIKVILYADKKEVRTVLLSEENDWSYTFEDLDVYNKGKKIEYAINEVKVEGYETKIDGFTITNTYKVEKRMIPVTKIWEDKDNYCKLRPKSIIVRLFANGELNDTIELNQFNGWKYIFKDLDVYKEGKKIIYTIIEDEVNEYYSEVDGDMEKGFIITNTHFGEGGDDNPKTLDNIAIYIILLLVGIIGITKYSYSYIKSN